MSTPEKRRESARKWRAANKDKVREQNLKYRESQRESAKKWRAANKDKVREQQQRYRKTHIEQLKAYEESRREKHGAESRENYHANAEQRREKRRQRGAQNREREREYARRWSLANKEHRAEYSKKYQAEHADRVAESCRKWRSRNRERLRLYAINRYAIKIGSTGKCTVDEVQKLWARQGGLCAYFSVCGNSLQASGVTGAQRDHIEPLQPQDKSRPPGKNSIDNIQLLCRSCNVKKLNKDPYTFTQSHEGRLFPDLPVKKRAAK